MIQLSYGSVPFMEIWNLQRSYANQHVLFQCDKHIKIYTSFAGIVPE
jgi:hypothetical protein